MPCEHVKRRFEPLDLLNVNVTGPNLENTLLLYFLNQPDLCIKERKYFVSF